MGGTPPSFSVTQIATPAQLTISWKSNTHNMAPGDVVVFEFPTAWVLPYGTCTCNFATATVCDYYPASSWIVVTLTSPVTAGSLQTGTISMNTPPFAYVVPSSATPITYRLFSRQVLMDRWTLPIMT